MARNRKRKVQTAKPQQSIADSANLESAPQRLSKQQLRRQRAISIANEQKRLRYLLYGVLAITAVVFLNSLSGEFVYDDEFQILKNPTLSSMANIPKMFVQSVWQFMAASSSAPVGLYYRPLFNAVLIINYHTFGQSPFGWHLFSLLLHLLATYLVYKVAVQWQITKETALAAALLFGVHPVHSESVAWVSGLPDPLAAVFLLVSLLCHEKYYRDKQWRYGKVYLLVLSLVTALLALFSKEVAIAFPVFLALRELLDNEEGEFFKPAFFRTLKRVLPFFAIVGIYLLIRYLVLGFIANTEVKAAGITTTQVISTIPVVVLKYTGMLFFPYPLAVVYDQEYLESPSDPRFIAASIVVAALFLATLWMTRSSQVGRRCLIWTVLFLLPVLNLKTFNPQESLIHDRYLYIPSIGFCILVALGLDWLSQFFKARQKQIFQTTVGILCAVLFILTLQQNTTWHDDLTLVNHALSQSPGWPFLHNYLGVYYFNKGNQQEAEKYYQLAINDNARYYDAYSNLADVHRLQNKLAEAEEKYLKAIELGAPYAETFYNLAVVYTSQGRLADVEAQLLRAIQLNPAHVNAHYNLGWAYDQQGKAALAEESYAKALAYNPAYPEPRINLAILLTKRGQYRAALDQLKTAQTYAADHSVMLFALGDVNMRLNQYQDGISALSRLIQREPKHGPAYTILGICYEGLGNKEQARASFNRSIEVAPDGPYAKTAREHLAKL